MNVALLYISRESVLERIPLISGNPLYYSFILLFWIISISIFVV